MFFIVVFEVDSNVGSDNENVGCWLLEFVCV